MPKHLSLIALLILSTTQMAFASPLSNGLAVSEKRVASEVGANILREGGNAIDAAVAIGYALAVTNQCCGNIGGGGFATIHLANGKNIFLNFREKAPLKAYKEMYLDKQGKALSEQSLVGYRAVGVPGTVLGLETIREKYGKLSRAKVIAPAIKLANDGFQVTTYDAKQFQEFAGDFAKQPNVAAIFLRNGKPYEAGEILKQKDLARTLQTISVEGPKAFYHGAITQKIVTASEQHGGLLTLNDFAKYNVEWMKPIYCTYRGYEIISSPPPSSGGVTLCEMLNILENFPLAKMGYRTPESTYTIIEAMHYGYLDRNNKLGDPDFVKNPTDQLIQKKYAKTISERIEKKMQAPVAEPQHTETIDTTHYSVIDKEGNAVAVTYTLNGFFGAEVMAKDTGFFLNDQMDDFAIAPNTPNKFGLVQSDQNAISGGKRPLSSMTPTIIMKNGKIRYVLGSPGGSRIITADLLTIINLIDYNMPLLAAINAPRFHFQVQPDAVELEPAALAPDTILALQKMGYKFKPQTTWGAVEAIAVDPMTQQVTGANDYRRPDGAAVSE